MVGGTLDRYTIESTLGTGGMGVVYKARDPELGRAVAIKVLPPDKVADPGRRQRFVQEARAASALNHPGIVTVYDIGSDAGTDFIVMEYIAGRTLDQAVPASGLPPKTALRYAVAIADALSKAHAAGLVHRDLKASNVMVTDDGHVKILDFGLAKLLDPADGSRDVTRTAALTDAGFVVGTASYMSPEQAKGTTVDARSDIFSFGILLYEMLTGRRPFVADSSVGVMAKILNDEPAPPSAVVATLAPGIDQIVGRCLRKDPARRYQTTADLKVVLEDVLGEIESGSLPAALPVAPAASSRAALLAGAAIVVSLLVAGAAAWRWWPPAGADENMRAVPLSTLPGSRRSPSFSPDANYLAFSWAPEPNNYDIYVQQVGAGGALQLTTDPRADYSPAWSPDGTWVAFLRSTPGAPEIELRLVPPLGGAERKVVDLRPRGFLRDVTISWCPDSTCVVVTDSTGKDGPDALFLVTLDGEKRQLTRPGPEVFADSDPAMSPDGRTLVYRREAVPFTGSLYAQALSQDFTIVGEPVRLTSFAPAAYGPAWTPDGAEIMYAASGGFWRQQVRAGATPERLPFVGEDGIKPAISRPGPGGLPRLAFVRLLNDSNVWRIETASPGAPATSPPVREVTSTRRDAFGTFAPDGGRLAFISNRTGDHEIWSAASGAGAVQLTSQRANPGFPVSSPDGRLVAFMSNPEGNADIFVVPTEGGKTVNLTAHPSTDTFPTFSRDGQWIYFHSTRSGQSMIWKVRPSGGAAVALGVGPTQRVIESPDGRFLYYASNTTTDSPATLWRVPIAGGTPERMADGVNSTGFVVLDRGVYYLDRVSGQGRLQYFDLNTRVTSTVASNLGTIDFGLDVSADGKTILFTRLDSSVSDLMVVENFR